MLIGPSDTVRSYWTLSERLSQEDGLSRPTDLYEQQLDRTLIVPLFFALSIWSAVPNGHRQMRNKENWS